MVGHAEGAVLKGDDVAAGAVAVGENESIDHEIISRQPQPRQAAQRDASERLGAQGDGLCIGARAGEEHVRIVPVTIEHQDGVARLRDGGGGGEFCWSRDEHLRRLTREGQQCGEQPRHG